MNVRAAPDARPVEVVSFGCRLNLVESEAVRRAASDAGHDNLIVINSCAVTAQAVKQARQTIRRLGRERPDAEIVVTGCAAQIEADRFAAMPEVTLVVGNGEKTRAETWLRGSAVPSAVSDIMQATGAIRPLADAIPGHTRAFVQVQTGCDHRCTFCIIPFGRGNSRSVPVSEVVEAIARLADAGTPEVVLTGVDLTSYGADLPGAPRLGDLVQAILRGVPGLRRLRLSSIDSVEIDAALLDALASEERLMPHLHLSLQAGDDLILKRMKRRHSHAEAVKICGELRRRVPEIVLGADIIAGFPTETEAMFARSLELVEACGLTHLHVFPFSPRPGTPAARMPQLAAPIVRERARRLRDLGRLAQERHLAAQGGRAIEILAENGGVGRARDFTPVRLEPAHSPGTIFTGRVSGNDGTHLMIAPGPC